MKRPDSPAVMGLLALAAVLGVGALVLIGMDRAVPPELWAIIAGITGGVAGWIGKTLTAEAPEPPPVVEAPELTPMGNPLP